MKNMLWAIRSIILVLVIGFTSCTNSHQAQMSPKDYVRYVETGQSNLKNTIRSGIWSYSIQFKPAAYIAIKEQDPQHMDKALVQKRISSLERTVWFNVAIKVYGKANDPLKYEVRDLNEYNSRLSYFLNNAAEHFHLSYGNKGEMKQIGYYFENNYNIKPEVVAIVGFSIPDASPQEAITLEYDDELFNAGILKFNISPVDLQHIPAVSI